MVRAGGPLSQRLVALTAGEGVLVAPRPTGFPTLNELPAGAHLWLMATGTGLGPFLSILRSAEPWERFERIVLIHAVRRAGELAYAEEIGALARARPRQFAFVPFVSREAADFALDGRIPQAIADGRLEARAGLALDPAVSRVMLCGNPGMIDDALAAFSARGFKNPAACTLPIGHQWAASSRGAAHQTGTAKFGCSAMDQTARAAVADSVYFD